MTERVGVLIKDGVVVNAIVWADHTADQLANDGWDHLEEVTGRSPRPSIGWTWTKKDGLMPPKPFNSWVWVDGDWQPPLPEPDPVVDHRWAWNEAEQRWDLVNASVPVITVADVPVVGEP